MRESSFLTTEIFAIESAARDWLAAAEAEAAENDGVISDETAATLDAIDCDRDAMHHDIARHLKNIRASVESISTERKKLQSREKSLSIYADQLVDLLSKLIPDGEKRSWGDVSAYWSGSDSCKLRDGVSVDQLPESFVKVERSPKIADLKSALKAGDSTAAEFVQIEKNRFLVVR